MNLIRPASIATKRSALDSWPHAHDKRASSEDRPEPGSCTGRVLGQPKAAESTRRVRRDRTSAGFKSEFAVRVAKYPPFDVLGGPPRGVPEFRSWWAHGWAVIAGGCWGLGTLCCLCVCAHAAGVLLARVCGRRGALVQAGWRAVTRGGGLMAVAV